MKNTLLRSRVLPLAAAAISFVLLAAASGSPDHRGRSDPPPFRGNGAMSHPGQRGPVTKKDLRISREVKDRMSDGTEYVRVLLRTGRQPAESDLGALGIVRLAGRSPLISVFVPVTNLARLATDLPGLGEVLPSLPPCLDAVAGEEVASFRATNFTRRGFDGSGVRVAVIDGGFAGLSSAIASGDLPPDVVQVKFSDWPVDFNSGPGSEHGTAVAEIIHEVAPAATLYLIRIDDAGGLLDAADYCVSRGIRIVNHSMGWFLDGWNESESEIVRLVVAPLFRTNVLWVNSAGNSARYHYQSYFANTDADPLGRHDFGVGTNRCRILNAAAGDFIELFLDWNGFADYYGQTGLFANYDLYLFNKFNVPVASSERMQPAAAPYERITNTVQPGEDGDFTLEVRRVIETRNYEFQVFSANHELSPYVEASSLLTPADSSAALAVGAVPYSNWNKQATNIRAEYYSSRGPSKTGRVKPDVVGIDRMTNWTYTENFYSDTHGRFPGTSAAAPSVAGLAALLLSKQPWLSSDQLYWTIVDNAEDVGPAGGDNVFGAGKARLELFPVRRNSGRLQDDVIVAPTRVRADRRIFYYGVTDETVIRLLTVDGVALKEFGPVRGPYATGSNFIDLSGVDLADSLYLLEFSAVGHANVYRKIIVAH